MQRTLGMAGDDKWASLVEVFEVVFKGLANIVKSGIERAFGTEGIGGKKRF